MRKNTANRNTINAAIAAQPTAAAPTAAQIAALMAAMDEDNTYRPMPIGDYDVQCSLLLDETTLTFTFKISVGTSSHIYKGLVIGSGMSVRICNQMKMQYGKATFSMNNLKALKTTHIWVTESTYVSKKTGLPTAGVDINFRAPLPEAMPVVNPIANPF